MKAHVVNFRERVRDGFDGQPFMHRLVGRLESVGEGTCGIEEIRISVAIVTVIATRVR